MDFESIVAALMLLALLFGWYAWLEAGERRRGRFGETRRTFKGAGDGQHTRGYGQLWKTE
jgi:hypothetical protein